MIVGGIARHEISGDEEFLFPSLSYNSNALRKFNDIIHKFLPSGYSGSGIY